jgi:hypothetical protein
MFVLLIQRCVSLASFSCFQLYLEINPIRCINSYTRSFTTNENTVQTRQNVMGVQEPSFFILKYLNYIFRSVLLISTFCYCLFGCNNCKMLISRKKLFICSFNALINIQYNFNKYLPVVNQFC